jgi:large subunit ribosomal protein L4
MLTFKVYNHDGSDAGALELPKEVFGIEPSMTAIYQVVKAYLANKRQGNASTLTRSDVDVTKAKPFRQNGTGRARAGSANSPIWVGGGVTFGPRPRDYDEKVNKKVRKLGLKSAYSIKATEEKIYIVEDFSINAPKTKEITKVLKAIGVDGKKNHACCPRKG